MLHMLQNNVRLCYTACGGGVLTGMGLICLASLKLAVTDDV